MPGLVVPLGDTKPANKNTIFFVKESAAPATAAAEPGALTLFTSEAPLLFELHDLCSAAVGKNDLGVAAQAADADAWVILQELTVRPFPRSTCPESCNHNRENNLRATRVHRSYSFSL